jgi:hypothetical protein
LAATFATSCVGAPGKGPAAPVRAAAARCPAGTALVWQGEFDGAAWLSSWDPHARFDFGEANTQVLADARFGSILRVHYPAKSSSSSYAAEGHPLGGAQFRARLPGDATKDVVALSYWVRFDPAFSWVRGGKLPGLCGGTCPSGGARVTGHDGWSVRTMWRPSGAGEVYAYILPAQEYGTELGLGAWSFIPGQWHRLTVELMLNHGDLADGSVRVWVDEDPTGKATFEEGGLTFRRDSTGATVLFFSTFFGGHDASWATPVDTFADFAGFTACR